MVVSDTLNCGIGSVKIHIFPESEKAIAYASRFILPAECNYSQIGNEALTIAFAIK